MLEFGNKVVGKTEVGVVIELTEYDIETIIVNGLEGGIDYWAGLHNVGSNWENKPKDEPNSMWATKILLDGGEVKFYDVEEDEDEEGEWTLTLNKLIEGYRLNFINRPHDNSLEDGDAQTADCIIQYALFGEVVYG